MDVDRCCNQHIKVEYEQLQHDITVITGPMRPVGRDSLPSSHDFLSCRLASRADIIHAHNTSLVLRHIQSIETGSQGLYGILWSLMGRVKACGEHHVVEEAEVLDGGTVLANACEHGVAVRDVLPYVVRDHRLAQGARVPALIHCTTVCRGPSEGSQIGEDGIALLDHIEAAIAKQPSVSSAAITCHIGVTGRQTDHAERHTLSFEVTVHFSSVVEEAGGAREVYAWLHRNLI